MFQCFNAPMFFNARMLECENENNAGCFCHNAGINAVQPSTTKWFI